MSNRGLTVAGVSPLLYRLYAGWRGARQEQRIVREQVAYAGRQTAADSLAVGDRAAVRAALQRRLAERGLTPQPKPRGALRVVYATRPSNWEPHNIPPALERFGDVVPYYYAMRGFDEGSSSWLSERAQLDADLLAFVRAAHRERPVDAFVGYLGGWQVSPDTIRAIGALGILTFAFHWDDRLAFRGRMAGGRWTGPAATAQAYDLSLTNAPSSIVKYQAEGGLALFWPEAANPDFFRPLDRPFRFDVSFVGGCYGFRPILIDFLRRNGIRVETFGPGWPNGSVPEAEMVEIYAGSRVNLGFGGIGYSMRAQCLKGRDFEVPMCGAVYLTSDNPDLHRVFGVGREIETYRSKEHCLEQIRYLLAHPEAAEALRCAARTRCLRDHTWERRFADVFAVAGLLEEAGT